MSSRTRPKKLARATIVLDVARFAGADLIAGLERTEVGAMQDLLPIYFITHPQVPDSSLTMGVATVMEVKELVLIFNGR